MPQRRTLSEQEYQAVAERVVANAPNNLSEPDFQRYIGPAMTQALAEAEYTAAPVEGSATRRFVGGVADMLNPIEAAKGLYQTVRHPIQTGMALIEAQAEQFRKAGETPTLSEKIGHTVAGVLPVLGPVAADIGEQIAADDVAGGLGATTGLLAPIAAVEAVRATRAVPTATRNRVAGALERGATERLTEVMAPKVGPNKTRFGTQAEKLAPQLLKDPNLTAWSREGFHTTVAERLSAAEQALDAAASARNPNLVFHTRPLIRELQQRRAQQMAATVRSGRTVAGQSVVPGPNTARVAVIDQAIGELNRLGNVANYEAIRRIRQAYDGPAKAIYSPSMTADYLKAQGGKLGAADVTGVLRTHLAKWDPKTATANAEYSLMRAADEVLRATAEVERTRPHVGRQIMARLTGTVAGGQTAGATGAITGFVFAPVIEAALSAGVTSKIKTAQLMSRLAEAVRTGSVGHTTSVVAQLKRLMKQFAVPSAVQTGRVTTEAQAMLVPAQ